MWTENQIFNWSQASVAVYEGNLRETKLAKELNPTRLCSAFQLPNIICCTNTADSVPLVETGKGKNGAWGSVDLSMQIVQQKPSQSCYCENSCEPSQHIQALISAATCSDCSLPPLCTWQDALEVCLLQHSSYTHLYFKEEKVHHCIQATFFW